ncbi:MAG: carboxylesterase family protein [Lachnospiraceae bacterium]|nr:carboxylesterase family protein [Lachnospiraceae bacterium]
MLREVEVKNGKLKGLIGKDPRIAVFRGVPYAQPPVGELRWKAPEPAKDWEGVRECYEYGDMAMMRVHPGIGDDFYTKELHPTAASYGMSEDCLYLNIFTPAETKEDNLPVFCYIHGGGYQDGYNYEVEFDGERVARRGVVVVNIAYRLGLFGFLAHPEITARTGENEIISNFGMQDQSLALHWVKENIRAFGGNPDQIVICGQSAGAGSVQSQLCSPYNEGIIKGAIIQSGVSMAFFDEKEPFGKSIDLDVAEQRGVTFFKDAGIKDLEEAMSMSAEDLMEKVRNFKPSWAFGFSTIIDGKFVKESVWDSYYNGRVPNVPLIVGCCFGETQGGLFVNKKMTYADFEKWAENFGDKKDEVIRASGITNDEEAAKVTLTDSLNMLLSNSRAFCELRSAQGRETYLYLFDHDIPGDDAGSFHGSDLWFMFDSLGNSWRPFEGKHYDLARQVTSYWTNFVKTGNPNGKDYNGNPLPQWKAYKSGERDMMKFADTSTPVKLEDNPVLDMRLEFSKKKFIK